MSKLYIGVCGWGDHDLYPPGTKSSEKLSLYAGHFPVVELDSTFYAIAPAERMARWTKLVPASFRFVVKANRELTGHGRTANAPVRTWSQLVKETKESLQPMQAAGKLAMLLFQFPPWYDCTQSHVRYIQKVRIAFADVPLAIEFRHASWFTPIYCERTLNFLRAENLIHVVCDEPQFPIITKVTNKQQVLIRFHGRNEAGWNDNKNPNWRDIRYAYRYSDSELEEWVGRIKTLEKQGAEQIIALFNNNSQGDAAANAKQMIEKLGIAYEDLAPRQGELEI
jgi:uncharacterized protein YecE (DUF72 family)